jgi:hypothetical protein
VSLNSILHLVCGRNRLYGSAGGVMMAMMRMVVVVMMSMVLTSGRAGSASVCGRKLLEVKNGRMVSDGIARIWRHGEFRA